MIPEFNQQNAVMATEKYYTPKMIQIGTFLGGPIVAGYFIGENYKAFGQQGKVSASWGYSILATVVLLVVVMIVPNKDSNGSFKYIIPIMYSWAAFSLVKYLQSSLIDEHVSAGGSTFGWGRVILISLIGCVVTVTIFFVLAFILIALFPSLG